MSIKKILVAVDGSKPAAYGAYKAIELAKSLGAGLTILYIISPPTYLDLGYVNVGRMNKIESKEKKHAQGLVDKIKNKAIKNDITVKTDVLVGYASVVKAIIQYAEKNKMDLIVTGSRGMSGFKKMLLGSVASGVVTYAHCPVLVVK
ncbi:MAG TPA: universal stress protein [Nitrososphaeraceae archaeon]|nr:universal stress protein [Nitrososphaeraceae archaeon]